MSKKHIIVLPKGFSQKSSLCIIASLIAANSSVLGFSSPVCVSVSAVLPLPLSLVFTAATFLWEIVFGITSHSLAAMFASLIVCLIRFVQSRLSVKNNNFTQSLYPFAAYFICSLVFLISFSSSFADFLAALIFSAAVPTIIVAYNNRTSKQMLSLLFIAFITTVSSLDFVYINIGRIIGIYSVLAVGFIKGAATSCFVGILCAVSAALYNPEMFSSTVFVCIIGIISSGRGYKDKIRIPLYAIATAVICAFLSGGGQYEIGFIVDTFIATVAFIFTEDKALSFLSRFAPRSSESGPFVSVVDSYSNGQAFSLSSLQTYIGSISNVSLNRKPLDISSGIYSDMCLSCPSHNNCFSDGTDDMIGAISKCRKRSELISYSAKLQKRNEYMRILASKRQAKFHEAMSFINTLQDHVLNASNLSVKVKSLDSILTQKLRLTLKENNAEPLNSAVFNNRSLYIEYPKNKRVSELRLCLLVSELMSVDYPMPEVTVFDSFVRYFFFPKSEFSVDFGTVQICADNTACGDSYDCFTHAGKLYYILCDGMGTGKAAKVSSSLLISLIKQQIMHDTSAKAAISLSALIMRLIELDESFATLDLLSVDLNTGECEFYKSGSCLSYVIGEGITTIPSGGYPIGILSDVGTKYSKISVSKSTVIVMFSDGAKDIPYQLIEKTVRESMSVSCEEIAENIMEMSQISLKNSQRDDITVSVIKIDKRIK